MLCLVTQSYLTLHFFVYGDSLGKNARVSCHVLLQGMFPTQGSNIGLLHCRWILYHLSHQGSQRILEMVACSFSRGSFWPRNWTGVSCIAHNLITSWDTREDPCKVGIQLNSLEPFLEKNCPFLMALALFLETNWT